jgi:hypothetical protein
VRPEKRKRILIGAVYLVAGLAALAIAWPPGDAFDWGLWSIFTIAFVLLSFQSVEVNDRQFASSSQMVVLTAGVYFALSPDASPVLAMSLLVAAGPLTKSDFANRRVFLPAFNFGQLIVSAFAAGVVLSFLIDELAGGRRPNLTAVMVATGSAALVYTASNNLLVQIGVRLVYGTRQIIPWSRLGVLFVSQVSMGVLGGLLGVVLFESNAATIPLVLIVYVIGHLVFLSYSKLREAHESTLKGFILALEARDLYTRGHTERVAYFCRLIGEQLAFTGTQMERMRWAAIIHDMGKLAVPVEIMEKQGRLTDAEYRSLRRASHKVDDLMSQVEFLNPMVQICSGSHPRLPHEDFGQTGHTHTTRPTLEQKVLAVADAFDAMTSTRGYRMAFTQPKAFATLREDETALYDNEVIAALERGLSGIGRSYGPPDIVVETEEAANA